MNHQANRHRVAQCRQRKIKAGLVRRERWAHSDDWPAIDAYMAELSNDRNGK
jgi:hypothetical protein